MARFTEKVFDWDPLIIFMAFVLINMPTEFGKNQYGKNIYDILPFICIVFVFIFTTPDTHGKSLNMGDNVSYPT